MDKGFSVFNLKEQVTYVNPIAISLTEYEEWKREFTFDSLMGLRYGQSFCNRFNITDNLLYYTMTPQQSDAYIKKHYIQD